LFDRYFSLSRFLIAFGSYFLLCAVATAAAAATAPPPPLPPQATVTAPPPEMPLPFDTGLSVASKVSSRFVKPSLTPSQGPFRSLRRICSRLSSAGHLRLLRTSLRVRSHSTRNLTSSLRYLPRILLLFLFFYSRK
jgi:hypothetical protein